MADDNHNSHANQAYRPHPYQQQQQQPSHSHRGGESSGYGHNAPGAAHQPWQQQQQQQHHRPHAAGYSNNEWSDDRYQRGAGWGDRPPRSDPRYEPYEDHRNRANERVPPPRREHDSRWQNDHYQDREHSHGEGSSTGPAYDQDLIRFPSPDYQHQQPQHQAHQRYPQQERYPREERDEGARHYRHSPPAHSSRRDGDLPEKPRRKPRTPPNQSVILIGIPPMCDGDDVRAFIDEFKSDPSDPSPVEDVTIVMDKQTGMSKRFGFVRFISLEHARAFVEANYDHVFWKSRGSHDIVEDGVKIRVDYASDDRRPGEARPRKREYDQVIREERPPVIMNDGSKDMGSTPNHILLIRNLDPLTNETHILSKLENLDEAGRERTKNAQGPKRIILIKDRESNASWCFAFAVFPDIECAKAALRTILDPSAFPQGFTIQNKLAAVTFARAGCFKKAYAKTAWSFPDGTDDSAQEHLYWDDAAYGLLYDSPAYRNAFAAKAAEVSKGDDVDAFLNSLAGEGHGLMNDVGIVQPPPAINLSLAGALGLSGQSVKEKKKPTELILSKKIAVDINKWNQKKAEAATPDTAPETAAPAIRDPVKVEQVKVDAQQTSPATSSPLSTLNTDGLDFADLSDISVPKCLLCQRQFKSLEVLQKHSKQSELHKTNLADGDKVASAIDAISKIPVSSTATGAVSQYRDRALERRIATGQPDHSPPPTKRQKLVTSADFNKSVISAPEKEIEQDNIGSKLLANMGWSAGSGLGSAAVGRVVPVQAKAFASGAGIGASQGVTATEKANETWGGKDFGRMKAAQRMAESQKRQ